MEDMRTQKRAAKQKKEMKKKTNSGITEYFLLGNRLLLYFTLLYFTLHYFTLLYFTLLYFTTLYLQWTPQDEACRPD